MNISVRKGTEEDLPAALSLVKELALYEKCPDEVEVTVSEMRNWGFGNKPVFEFFVALDGNHVVATAIYYYKYSTWKGRCLFLEDIIVTASERRKGIGRLLFDQVVKVAKAEHVRRLEWQVLDWNTDAIAFYNRYQSHYDGEWINCKLLYSQLQAM